MDFILTHLLTLILFVPTLAAAVVLFLPAGEIKLIRWVTFIASLIPFGLALVLWLRFNSGLPGFQFEEQLNWYPAIHSSFHLGIDGLSLLEKINDVSPGVGTIIVTGYSSKEVILRALRGKVVKLQPILTL